MRAGIILVLMLASLTAACDSIPLGDIRDSQVSPGTSPTPERVN